MDCNSIKLFKIITNRSVKDSLNLISKLKNYFNNYIDVVNYLDVCQEIIIDNDIYLLYDLEDKFNINQELYKLIEDQIEKLGSSNL